MVLSLSPKLFIKLAIKYGFPIRSAANSTDGDITRIVFLSRKIVKRSGIKFESAWLLHQADKVFFRVYYVFLVKCGCFR
jgi:hypothetical protein